MCCLDYFLQAEEKKLELAEKRREFCPTCNCYFYCINDELVAKHLNSKNHIQNQQYLKKDDNLIKESQAICNKSLNTSGTHLIPNLTRMKKVELIENMNYTYSSLAFD